MENHRIPKAGDFYLDFEHKLYQILTLAIDTHTKETLVIYQALYGEFTVYSRPLSEFDSKVDHEKHPKATEEYLFQYLAPEELQHFHTSSDERKESTTSKADTHNTCLAQEEHKIHTTEAEQPIEVKSNQEVMTKGQENPSTKSSNEKKTYRFIDAAPKTLMDFLDADTDTERLDILHQMRTYIDHFTLDSISVSLDYVPNGDSIEERYYSICKYLEMKINYESKR